MASRKHWVLRGRIPPNIGDSAADIQPFVGEAVNVTTAVTTQLRAIIDFDVCAYGPRAEGMVDHPLMVADRLDFFRQALVGSCLLGFPSTARATAVARGGWQRSMPPSRQRLPAYAGTPLAILSCSLAPRRGLS